MLFVRGPARHLPPKDHTKDATSGGTSRTGTAQPTLIERVAAGPPALRQAIYNPNAPDTSPNASPDHKFNCPDEL